MPMAEYRRPLRVAYHCCHSTPGVALRLVSDSDLTTCRQPSQTNPCQVALPARGISTISPVTFLPTLPGCFYAHVKELTPRKV